MRRFLGGAVQRPNRAEVDGIVGRVPLIMEAAGAIVPQAVCASGQQGRDRSPN
jgi:hypothetical protein